MDWLSAHFEFLAKTISLSAVLVYAGVMVYVFRHRRAMNAAEIGARGNRIFSLDAPDLDLGQIKGMFESSQLPV